jgi:hypothetical protein
MAGIAGGGGGRRPRALLVFWAGIWVFLLLWPAAAAFTAPAQVNAAAYLAGVGPSATFVPQSQHQLCGRGGCRVITDGVLESRGSRVATSWDGDVPLGQPFRVREPAWAWGLGTDLVKGAWQAAWMLALMLVLDLIAAGAVCGMIAFVKGAWRPALPG